MCKCLNAYQLKWIAMAAMLVDHLYSHFGIEAGWPGWLGFVGRFVAPLFAYLLVDGFFHTSSRKKYAIRLGAAAAVMQIGTILLNCLIRTRNPLGQIGNNILLTLFVLFCLMWSIQTVRDKAARRGLRILCGALIPLLCAAALLHCEGGIYLLPFVLITYFCYRRACLRYALYLLFFAGLFALAVFGYNSLAASDPTMFPSFFDYLSVNNESFMVTVLPFLLLYDGTRGPSGPVRKWLFYAFYPLHLWIIGLIEYALF